jgi:Cu/Ag efflux protein CusF
MMHRMILAIVLTVCVAIIGAPVLAQNVVDFAGIVLKVDEAAGKLTVKNAAATRFAFIVDGRTQYAGVKTLKELKEGDTVTVSYVVLGSRYVAQKITKQ